MHIGADGLGGRRATAVELVEQRRLVREDLPEGLQARARSATRRRSNAASTSTKRSWRQLVGETTGFMKYERELPTRRPIPVRVLDWQEVYEDFPAEKVRMQGARCMDCGIPFCHTGCPLGNLIPEWNDLVYRDRLEGGAPTGCTRPTTSPSSPAGCARRRARRRACSGSTSRRSRSSRSRSRSSTARGKTAGSRRSSPQTKTGKRVAVVGSRPVGTRRGAAAHPRRPRRDGLRTRRSHRRAAALRHSRVQDGEAAPRPPHRADGRRRARSSASTPTSASNVPVDELQRVRRGRARGRRDGVARPAGSRARAHRHLPGDGVPAAVEPRAGGRPRRVADHRAGQARRDHRRRRHRRRLSRHRASARVRRRSTSSRSCPARPTRAPTRCRGRRIR